MTQLASEFALNMEMNLTIALRSSEGDSVCANYLRSRRDVLFAEIMKKSAEIQRDPDDIFHEYQKKVHVRLCEEHPGSPYYVEDKHPLAYGLPSDREQA